MFKRLTAVLVLTLALVLGFAPSRQAVFSNVLSEAEVAVIIDSSATEDTQTKQDGGNRFVKVLAAPFKAIGRLFGHGGKKDDNKLHRLSEKDVKKFESSKTTRVIDARTPASPSTPETVDPKTGETDQATDANSADVNKKLAREHLQRARELFNQNDLNGAINALSMAVSLERELWDAHNLLGIAYEMKGLRSKALESLETAL